MPVDVQLDTLLVANLADESIHACGFGRIVWFLSSVSLGAWIGGGSAGISVPICLPIAVVVTTETCLVCCTGWWWLSVLAPHTVVCLGEDEACSY
jgi:hypothetical protein